MWKLRRTRLQLAITGLRKELELSQDGLARALGKAVATIAAWESKGLRPNADSLYKLRYLAKNLGQSARGDEIIKAWVEEGLIQIVWELTDGKTGDESLLTVEEARELLIDVVIQITDPARLESAPDSAAPRV
jgi:transcriptional regulator with XRE-family HTH domain